MKTTYIISIAKSGVHLLNEIHLCHLYRKKVVFIWRMKTTYDIFIAKSGVHLENENHLCHLYRKKWRSTGE
ncbi:hypothetical protein [Niallia circulans]|uniref:hypothetical protein n=1 Tax=Niallia circulans TaxID=1397 RepID=UPI003525C1C6